MKKLADINIKNVSEATKAGIKEKAKKANMSEQKYLRRLLDTHVISEEVEGVQKEHEEVLKSVRVAIEHNTKVLETFIKMNEG